MKVDRPDPTLFVLTSDVASVGLASGDKVHVGSTVYTVVRPAKDVEGMSEITLRVYK